MDPRCVIRKIQVTEKGTAQLADSNKYFFEVAPDANKIEIAKAVEETFGVKVAGVNTQRYQGKRKRERTVRFGRRADWKRAIVTLKDDSKIDMV